MKNPPDLGTLFSGAPPYLKKISKQHAVVALRDDGVANAADTSQRFDPTGRASKGARPGKPRQGGMQPPKRGKS